MCGVDVRSDIYSDHTTIAVRMPGFTNKEDAEYMRRHVEYELHKMQQHVMQNQLANNPYLNTLGGNAIGQLNQTFQAQAAGVQSAQPKAVKKKARKKLLLCEAQNAV